MRCIYREKKYFCGNYLDVDIYPVYKYQNSRRRKSKPTSEVQEKLNQINAEKKLTRLLNTNFTEDDLRFDLTYATENLPNSDEQAKKEMQNFLRRLKRFRKRENLSELKYVAVTEKSLNGRYHHHLVINGGVSIKNLAELWGRGYTQARPLQFNEYGLVGMAKYLVKSPLGKRWSSSKNLKRPTVVQRDGRFSAKKLKEIYNDDKIKDINNLFSELFEKTFNYEFVESKPFFNDRNGGYYLCVKMFKPKPKPKRKNK